jgi:hypothetical protein
LRASGRGPPVNRRPKIKVPMVSQKNTPMPNALWAARCQPRLLRRGQPDAR